jgi:pSer/pThr/pTyr-binding forkhead associated (FHA) protein
MTNIFDQVENLIQVILEKKIFTWLPGGISLRDILQKVVEALIIAQRTSGAGITHDVLIKVSPAVYGLWISHQMDLVELGHILAHELEEENRVSNCSPIFHVLGDLNLQEDDIDISVIQYQSDSADTTYMEPLITKSGVRKNTVVSPYLIDPADNIVNISKTVFNIGRRVDNDLALEDARVSRQHAQIRYSPDGCILFDLNSTGGTFINNNKVIQQKLHSGDVISLAGVTLIYGEELQQDPNDITDCDDHSQTKPPDENSSDNLEYIG